MGAPRRGGGLRRQLLCEREGRAGCCAGRLLEGERKGIVRRSSTWNRPPRPRLEPRP